MATFEVGLFQRVWEETTIRVEADTPEQAQEMAIAKALNGECQWQFVECDDGMPYEIGEIVPFEAFEPQSS